MNDLDRFTPGQLHDLHVSACSRAGLLYTRAGHLMTRMIYGDLQPGVYAGVQQRYAILKAAADESAGLADAVGAEITRRGTEQAAQS